jgi:ribose 5-phosphate isomerase A
LREKVVAASAERFVVIADSSKPVAALHSPIPLELHQFGLRATLRELGAVTLRDAAPSPDGGVLADYHGDVDDPRELSSHLDGLPGVSAHGLFAPEMVSEIIVATGKTVSSRNLGGPR